MNDDVTSHTIFGAFANIGFAGTTVHSCTRQAFAGLLNAVPLNQMNTICSIFIDRWMKCDWRREKLEYLYKEPVPG